MTMVRLALPAVLVAAISTTLGDTPDGRAFADAVNLARPDAGDAAYIEAADRIYGRDGELEVDDDAVVSRGADAGAYVQCWHFVTNEEAAEQASFGEGDTSDADATAIASATPDANAVAVTGG
jgi:hypothetical protein